MKKILVLLLLLFTAPAFALPPYDATITFTPPITGGTPDGYRLYVDDCAVTGPVATAVGTVTSGQTFTSLFLADGTYAVCVRAFNTAGENPNPGPVATVTVNDLPLPGPVNSLDVIVSCPNGGCTVNVTVN
jgi:hypothetical protein